MARYSSKSASFIEKVNSLKSGCAAITENLGDRLANIITNFEIGKKALDELSNAIHNANMTAASKLRETVFFPASPDTKYLRLWTETELTQWLNEKTKRGQIKTLFDKLSEGLTIAQKFKEYIDKIEPIVKIGISIQTMIENQRYTFLINSRQTDDYSTIKTNVDNAAQQYLEFMKIVGVINGFAPSGLKEYIDLNLTALKGAEKLFSIARQYADLIHDLSRENAKAWDKAINNIFSWWNATLSIKNTGADVNKYLDLIESLEKSKRK